VDVIRDVAKDDVSDCAYIRPMFTFTHGDDDDEVDVPEIIYQFTD
jgi:hypothetical protein